MSSSAAPTPTPSHPGLLALAAALGRQAAREDHAARKAAAEEACPAKPNLSGKAQRAKRGGRSRIDNPPRSSDR